MAQKIISVSISRGDKEFMKHKFLSPSRLLQERIHQIRDFSEDGIKKEIENLNKKIEVKQRRLVSFEKIVQGFGREIRERFGNDEFEKIIEVI